MRGGGGGWEVEELSLVKDNREVMSSHPGQYVRKACQDPLRECRGRKWDAQYHQLIRDKRIHAVG